MKKTIVFTLLIIMTSYCEAQTKVTYQEYFDYDSAYCPGSRVYNNWVKLLSSIDTQSNKFVRLTMKGTYDLNGVTCTDKDAVRAIADAMHKAYSTAVWCDGRLWQVGLSCSAGACSKASDNVELTINQNQCICGHSYTVRPCSGDQNWGGINTETCQKNALNAKQNMVVEFERLSDTNNLASRLMLNPNSCENTQDLMLTVQNMGKNQVNNYFLGYSINGVVQPPVFVNAVLASAETSTVRLKSAYTFTPNTSYTFKIWTFNPNGYPDPEPGNDTFELKHWHTGQPVQPTGNDWERCGRGYATLSANASDTIVWYDAPNNGNALQIGSHYTTPLLYATTTYYAEANRFKNHLDSGSTGFHNITYVSNDYSEYNGAMIDITPKALINLSGLRVQTSNLIQNPYFMVYIKEGSFAGYENDSTAWSILFQGTVPNKNSFATIPVNQLLKPNTDYSFYVTTNPVSGELLAVNVGGNTYSNSDLSVVCGPSLYGKFGQISTSNSITLDCELIYKSSCQSPGRQAIKATIHPLPTGSELFPVANFNGKIKYGYEAFDPDIMTLGQQLQYEYTPPSDYTNSEHGSTWAIDQVKVETLNGKSIDPAFYSFSYPGTDNGIFTFTPDASLLDSTLKVSIRCKDLGPYLCDTTVSRFFHVAPIPVANFTYPNSICEDNEVAFTNLSTIHSGRMIYQWKFNNTDSSDHDEPTYRFSDSKVYSVTLKAISQPYEIEHDTTINITIKVNPVVDYTVVNACFGNAVQLMNKSVNPNAIYTWDFGDNSPTSQAYHQSHQYASADAYVVQLSATGSNGCTVSVSKKALAFPNPTAEFTMNQSPICMTQAVPFINKSRIEYSKLGELWQFDDGDTSTAFSPTHQFTREGTYNVKLISFSEFGCKDSVTHPISILAAAPAEFEYDVLCKYDVTHFKNKTREFPSVQTVYHWILSDGTSATTRDISKKWATTGLQTVTLKATSSNGCSSELSKKLNILNQAIAKFEVNDVCENEKAQFANQSTVADAEMTYQWYFGDNSPVDTSMMPLHTYRINKTTTFNVDLVVSIKDGCNDTAFRQMTVTTVPKCDFTFNKIDGKTYRFTPANNDYETYEWTFGDGGYSNSKSPQYRFRSKDTFMITLRARNANCDCYNSVRLGVSLTGIDNIVNHPFAIYPNPGDQSITIDLLKPDEAKIKIYNSVGQLLVNQTLYDPKTAIYTGDLGTGIYTVVVERNGTQSSRQISIVH